jgi:hypothetical protein
MVGNDIHRPNTSTRVCSFQQNGRSSISSVFQMKLDQTKTDSLVRSKIETKGNEGPGNATRIGIDHAADVLKCAPLCKKKRRSCQCCIVFPTKNQ